MWKFKKEIILALFLSIIILVYTIFIKNSHYTNIQANVYILNNYTFMFVFSTIIFYLFFDTYNFELTMCRLKKIEEYIFFEIKNMIISLGIFFLILTINQIIIFTIFDPLFKISTLIYQNIIFLWLFFIFYLVIFLSKRKNWKKVLIVMFIIWNLLYIVYILFPENVINQITIFRSLKEPAVYEILRLFIFNLIEVYGTYIKIKSKKRKILE